MSVSLNTTNIIYRSNIQELYSDKSTNIILSCSAITCSIIRSIIFRSNIYEFDSNVICTISFNCQGTEGVILAKKKKIGYIKAIKW